MSARMQIELEEVCVQSIRLGIPRYHMNICCMQMLVQRHSAQEYNLSFSEIKDASDDECLLTAGWYCARSRCTLVQILFETAEIKDQC